MTAPLVELNALPACKPHTKCRVCGSPLNKPYLDLGEQPLANALVTDLDKHKEKKYPLAVSLCETCGLSQLTVVVDPKILYTHYNFASGISRAWLCHCNDLVTEVEKEKAGGFVIDIAANDGSQLQQFKGSGKWKVLGVEPSDVPPVALTHGIGGFERAEIPMLRTFWSQIVADNILRNDGPADIIVAQNVFGHVDDAIGFLKACKSVLKDDGYLIIEVPNVGDLIDNLAFDTIYHEHLSYWSGLAMDQAARNSGLRIARHERFPQIHGGSVRYWLEHSDEKESEGELGWFSNTKPYLAFRDRVTRQINHTAALLSPLHKKKFYAWGASAKGTVMLNAIRNRWRSVPLPQAIFDQTPEKQGFLSPGTHIPIIAPPDDLSNTDVIWVLSWNWFEQIRFEARHRGFRGEYLITSPKPQLIR